MPKDTSKDMRTTTGMRNLFNKAQPANGKSMKASVSPSKKRTGYKVGSKKPKC